MVSNLVSFSFTGLLLNGAQPFVMGGGREEVTRRRRDSVVRTTVLGPVYFPGFWISGCQWSLRRGGGQHLVDIFIGIYKFIWIWTNSYAHHLITVSGRFLGGGVGVTAKCSKRMFLILIRATIHRVPKKTKQICFLQNFVKFPPILILFGRKMANDPNMCKVQSFSTSPNLRHQLTVLNANVQNCYITPNVVICNELLTT